MGGARTTSIELTSALQHVAVPSFLVDREGRFVWVNDAFSATFGDQRGWHYSVVVAPDFRDLVDQQFRRKLAGERVTDYEIEALVPEGGRVRVDISSVPVEGASVCIGVFGVAFDVRPVAERDHPYLTRRQLEVLELLARGASTDQIAESMTITRHTVRNYVRQVLRALEAHSRLEAVIAARRDGILPD